MKKKVIILFLGAMGLYMFFIIKEPLINPGRASVCENYCARCKAIIAGNSETIGKIINAAAGDFKLIDAVHVLIRGSFNKRMT